MPEGPLEGPFSPVFSSNAVTPFGGTLGAKITELVFSYPKYTRPSLPQENNGTPCSVASVTNKCGILAFLAREASTVFFS